jgi:hypothetical protein
MLANRNQSKSTRNIAAGGHKGDDEGDQKFLTSTMLELERWITTEKWPMMLDVDGGCGGTD